MSDVSKERRGWDLQLNNLILIKINQNFNLSNFKLWTLQNCVLQYIPPNTHHKINPYTLASNKSHKQVGASAENSNISCRKRLNTTAAFNGYQKVDLPVSASLSGTFLYNGSQLSDSLNTTEETKACNILMSIKDSSRVYQKKRRGDPMDAPKYKSLQSHTLILKCKNQVDYKLFRMFLICQIGQASVSL